MSDLSDLKKAFQSTVTGVAGIARDIAASAGDRAKTLGRLAKVTVQINTERTNLDKVYTEIGRLCYENNKGDPGELYSMLFSQVELAETTLTELEDEAATIKAGLGEEDACDCDLESVVSADEAAAEGDVTVEIIESDPTDEN